MRYSIGYGFLYFAKNMGKNLNIKYGQTLFDSAKESKADAVRTASKEQFNKKRKQLMI